MLNQILVINILYRDNEILFDFNKMHSNIDVLLM